MSVTLRKNRRRTHLIARPGLFFLVIALPNFIVSNRRRAEERTERRAEGRTEGRAEERTEGREEGRTEGRADGRESRQKTSMYKILLKSAIECQVLPLPTRRHCFSFCSCFFFSFTEENERNNNK